MKRMYENPRFEIIDTFQADIITASCLQNTPPHCPGDGCPNLLALTDEFNDFLE